MSLQRSLLIPPNTTTAFLSLIDPNRSTAFSSDTAGYINGQVSVSVYGTATAFTAQVYRSPTPQNDPTGFFPVPVDGGITGNPAGGFQPVTYTESSFGYWYVQFLTITGGSITSTISGQSV